MLSWPPALPRKQSQADAEKLGANWAWHKSTNYIALTSSFSIGDEQRPLYIFPWEKEDRMATEPRPSHAFDGGV